MLRNSNPSDQWKEYTSPTRLFAHYMQNKTNFGAYMGAKCSRMIHGAVHARWDRRDASEREKMTIR